MKPTAADPAGGITVRLTTRDGRVSAVSLSSSRRTDFSRRLFTGRPVEHLLAILPRVFSVCATAQAGAAVQACEAAAGIGPDAVHLRARELLVLAETAREHLFRVLLGWSEWLQAPPAVPRLAALGRMRTAWSQALYPQGDAFHPGGGELAPDGGTLAGLVDEMNGLVEVALGLPAQDWLSIDDGAALADWSHAGDAVGQRMLRAILGRGLAGLGASGVGPLPDLDPGALAARLAADDADAFVASPLWDGAPCETGALSRQAAGTLVGSLRALHGNALLPRLAARLTELAAAAVQIGRLAGDVVPAAAGPGVPPVSGSGLAQVEAARGRLVHWVRLEHGTVTDYRILAPTEWNFHPQGALARGLMHLPADDELPRLARLLVDAVDPCVEARVEVDGHA